MIMNPAVSITPDPPPTRVLSLGPGGGGPGPRAPAARRAGLDTVLGVTTR